MNEGAVDYSVSIPTMANINEYWWPYNTTANSYSYWYTTPSSIYLYQIFCPKETCKTANWLELDKPKPCTNCSSILKAVSQKVDYEVEITS